MSQDTERAAWLAALRAGAEVPPRRPRVPLYAGPHEIGSVEPDFLSRIDLQPLVDQREVLQKTERGWRLHGEPTSSLALLADALREAGLAHAWRDEQLAVPNRGGERVATVERAVVRGLGITTQAVHLVGLAPDGRHWVQQRAFDKPNDPGLWDTLMGGMVSARDTVQTALLRETWEEAGLRLHTLQGLRHGGFVTTRRPSDDGGGAGYVIERIDWFVATLPEGLLPVNQDGEVERFELINDEELWRRMLADEFTTEAALIQAAFLGY
ncbi:NUDIX hydrolase [Rhodoferax koreense]|uniref:NUDIX hydrolase n=1 Tax=Rhodoferax koreensis TaxID=1842727 RepID=A0A1P8JZA8_9BURK|nr:NUDIX domain-containing protein [Rhodoferax koreense]APW39089.1 NUDIX hydrolase [Rhodoferax koreense]